MKSFKRILPYLLLNVAVSAITTLAVLWIWEQARGTLPGSLFQPGQVLSIQPAARTKTLEAEEPSGSQVSSTQPAAQYYLYYQVRSGDTFESIAQANNVNVDDLVKANGYPESQPLVEGETLRIPIHPVEIDGVIGAGDLSTERVIVRNNLDGEVSLAGWRLEDGAGQVYTFPQVMMFVKGGGVNLYTKAGTNSVIDLFWGMTAPVWQSGDQVILKDPSGKTQSTYMIP